MQNRRANKRAKVFTKIKTMGESFEHRKKRKGEGKKRETEGKYKGYIEGSKLKGSQWGRREEENVLIEGTNVTRDGTCSGKLFRDFGNERSW